MAEVHPFDLTNINQTQIGNASLSKRIMLDIGTSGDGVQASLYATPEQLTEMGADVGSTSNAIIRSKPSGSKKLAYSVVTIDDNGHVQGAGSLSFDTTPTSSPGGVGSMTWDDGYGSVALVLKGGNVTQDLGQGEVQLCYNSSGSVSLSKGAVVKITGAQGNRVAVSKAQADSEANSIHTMGFVAETIGTLSEGFVINSGLIKNLDTRFDAAGTALSAGDTLYLSPTTAGGFTKTKPTTGHMVILGFVVRVHQSVGSIFVKIDNGYELEELHDVVTTSEGSAFLIRNDSTDIWEDKTPSDARDVINGGIAVTEIGSNYTLALADREDILRVSSSSNVSITIPLNSSIPFPNGTTVTVVQYAEGYVTFSAASGVSLNVRGYGNATAGRWAVAMLLKVDTNTWILTGDITQL